MNADLEATLEELGPEYREVVGRLKSAYEPAVSAVRLPRPASWRLGAVLAAASLAACLVLGVHLGVGRATPPVEKVYVVRATDAAHEYRLALMRNDDAVKELIRTQGADGGWKTAFLTRQNAEALRLCSSAEARIAYKRALRNLRARGN